MKTRCNSSSSSSHLSDKLSMS